MKPCLATYKRGVVPKAGDKGFLCSEQHAGSAGALLDFGQPPHAQDQQPEAEGAVGEELEEEEEIVEEEEQQQQTFPVSLEDLAGHDGSEKVPGPELPGSEEEEESLAVAEQVADFASSLLAALHCWHYRANALLFSRGAMVRCLFDLPSSLHVVQRVHVLPMSFPLSPTLSPPSCCQCLTHSLSRPGEPLACTVLGWVTHWYTSSLARTNGVGQGREGQHPLSVKVNRVCEEGGLGFSKTAHFARISVAPGLAVQVVWKGLGTGRGQS